MYWQTRLTEKEISGLVIVAYCKAPIIDRYNVGSSTETDSLAISRKEESIGEGWGFELTMLVRHKRSLIYFA